MDEKLRAAVSSGWAKSGTCCNSIPVFKASLANWGIIGGSSSKYGVNAPCNTSTNPHTPPPANIYSTLVNHFIFSVRSPPQSITNSSNFLSLFFLSVLSRQ
ncbi:hypothetical protein VNO77_29850 [Canavalia gladiata]|uniref:Uncharacterized protein n=1 Tax=Canavalia gladiata TaxID=3824 RepID=A0AAN9KQH4_CANGL